MNRKRITIVTLLMFLLAMGAFGVSSFAATEAPDSTGGDAAYLEVAQDTEYAEYAKEVAKNAEENALTTLGAPIDISRVTISGIVNKTYSGKAITQRIVVKYGGTTLRNGVNYTLSYRNNKNVGTAKVVIYGKGKFKNRITKTFLINPKGTAVKSIKVETNAFTIAWAPQKTKMSTSPITGYQIHYSKDRNFRSGVGIITMGNINQTSRRIAGLTAGGKYYVRVRTYKKIGSKAYMGPWTPVREVRLKAASGEVAIAYQELNKFRTTKGVWYWNSDNKTKTVFNTNSSNQLKPLARDAALERTAQIRAQEIAIEFSHTRPDGSDCFTTYPSYSMVGENIAGGTSNVGGALVTTWWREDKEKYGGQGHRRNMLNPGFNAVGIASYKSGGWTYWVQALGRK